ncbi:hypothetical protein ASC97_23670 [Rhizobium sp. Root1203]|uniref:FAD:protein FMN transferase n=1 Tax=Rhizobium sp. Root1203 TaxID=1736427 RepID=UPI00070EFD95|nr:FAD:protein FMN transferase [Rhizobium sp. Root1203]KQV29329.1 hypothetical protein ASC97_23670 [Rhizobium sp. Root1203]
MSQFAFDAIGTRFAIDSETKLGEQLRRRIRDLADRFDRTYSRFREDSLISCIAVAEHGSAFEFPSDDADMFHLYDRHHLATDGAVDPLVGRDLELLGYDRHYSLRPLAGGIAAYATERPIWKRDVLRVGNILRSRRPLTIDLGAVGKGYLVDLISRLLVNEGFDAFTVDASGDIEHRGGELLQVGLEHPLDPKLIVGVARLRNSSLCASAVNRRAWGDGQHHMVDGRTGRPVTDVIATWVVSNDTATADGLATALFFAPASRLTERFDFSFVRMFADGSAEMSENFEGEVFT